MRFADAGFESKMVLPKRGGTDRSDMMMSLDIQEALSGRASEFDTVFILSGDSDFQEVIRRAKDKGFKVVVIGVAPTTAAGIISMADQYVAIEAQMGLNARVEIEMQHTLPDRDWTEFVQLLAELEAANKYVGLTKFECTPQAYPRVLQGSGMNHAFLCPSHGIAWVGFTISSLVSFGHDGDGTPGRDS